jgi:hypothetical protein
LKRRLSRAVRAAIALSVTVTGALFISIPAAQAYTCSARQQGIYYNSGGVSHASLTVLSTCSDGRLHFYGVIYDDKCDARAGDIALVGDPLDLGPGGYYQDWGYNAFAGNGCGTHSSFSGSETKLLYGHLQIGVGACNTFTCANWSFFDMYF